MLRSHNVMLCSQDVYALARLQLASGKRGH
jgi:hypothetical protein